MVRTPGLEPGSTGYKPDALTLELRSRKRAPALRSDERGLRYVQEQSVIHVDILPQPTTPGRTELSGDLGANCCAQLRKHSQHQVDVFNGDHDPLAVLV
jgi:hypothetical protein